MQEKMPKMAKEEKSLTYSCGINASIDRLSAIERFNSLQGNVTAF
jgi:hypothetical protein